MQGLLNQPLCGSFYGLKSFLINFHTPFIITPSKVSGKSTGGDFFLSIYIDIIQATMKEKPNMEKMVKRIKLFVDARDTQATGKQIIPQPIKMFVKRLWYPSVGVSFRSVSLLQIFLQKCNVSPFLAIYFIVTRIVPIVKVA